MYLGTFCYSLVAGNVLPTCALDPCALFQMFMLIMITLWEFFQGGREGRAVSLVHSETFLSL